MIFRQVIRDDLGCASDLVGDEAAPRSRRRRSTQTSSATCQPAPSARSHASGEVEQDAGGVVGRCPRARTPTVAE